MDLMTEKQIILITGSSKGIGRQLCIEYANAHRVKLLMLARNINDLKRLQNQLATQYNTPSDYYPFNLCSATLDDYDNLQDDIKTHSGKIDTLILNAGILGVLAPIEHYAIDKWFQVLQVNLNSKFLLIQSMLPLLKLSKKPRIIFMLDKQLSMGTQANWGAYAVANAACINLAQMLRAEYAGYLNIQVQEVYVPATNTDLRNKAYPAEDLAKLPTPEQAAHELMLILEPRSEALMANNPADLAIV
jgi:NAD(P)-dependent dehydrogenase (short-subunit alcohol dehydrogenase family)